MKRLYSLFKNIAHYQPSLSEQDNGEIILSDRSEKYLSPLSRAKPVYFLPLLVVIVIGLLLSSVLFQLTIDNNRSDLRRSFRNLVFQQFLLINDGVKSVERTLIEGAAFIGASEEVLPEEFSFFFDRSVGKSEIYYAVSWIPAEQLNQSDLVPDHLISPAGLDHQRRLTLINMPLVRQTLQQTAQRGEVNYIATSDSFFLAIRGEDQGPLLATAVPTYHYRRPAEPAGYLFAIIKADRFFAPVDTQSFGNVMAFLRPRPVQEQDEIRSTMIFAQHPLVGAYDDATPLTPAELMGDYPAAEMISTTMGSKRLSVIFLPLRAFQQQAMNWVAWMVLGLGLFLTAIVAFFLYVVLSRDNKIRALVQRRTQELAQSEARQRAILVNIADGVLTMDNGGLIHMFNPAAERIFSYRKEEVLNENIKALIPEPYWGDLEQLSKREGYKGIVKERTGLRKGGEEFPMEISFGGLGEELHQYVAVIRDISERKQAEQDLLRSHQALDDFVYIVSHDLKEPLRSIQNFAHILGEDCAEDLDQECHGHLDTIVRMTGRMQQQLDSLVRYSRAGHQDVEFTEINPAEVVAEVDELLNALIAETGATVNIVSDMPFLRCDRAALVEIFTNLIQNGIKYRKEDVPPVIEVGALAVSPEQGTTGPALYVRDNGIGIRQEHQAVAFKMFKRLHPREAYGGGTGSGLAIVKKLVERHNGAIWMDSAPGAGTTVYFTMQGPTQRALGEDGEEGQAEREKKGGGNDS